MKILVATNNKHKILEIKHILKDKNIKILSLEDVKNKTAAAAMNHSLCSGTRHGFSLRVKENGKTYFDNALKKAKAFAKLTKLPVLADDSGLEIEFLNGKPGIYSSRFMCKPQSCNLGSGPKLQDYLLVTFYEKNIKILKMMKDVPLKKRRARFVCHCVLIMPGGKIFDAFGECKGFIHNKISGKNGFGYDPIFYIPRFKKTMAQLPEKTKNKISHRAKAFGKIKKYIPM